MADTQLYVLAFWRSPGKVARGGRAETAGEVKGGYGHGRPEWSAGSRCRGRGRVPGGTAGQHRQGARPRLHAARVRTVRRGRGRRAALPRPLHRRARHDGRCRPPRDPGLARDRRAGRAVRDGRALRSGLPGARRGAPRPRPGATSPGRGPVHARHAASARELTAVRRPARGRLGAALPGHDPRDAAARRRR